MTKYARLIFADGSFTIIEESVMAAMSLKEIYEMSKGERIIDIQFMEEDKK